MDSPQFQKAEYTESGPHCSSCKLAMPEEYFRLSSGQTICPACAASFESQLRPPSHAALIRGLIYGTGMALACCIGYAVIIMITGLEIGLVAILVGYMVGKAVRVGSHGLGGRRCQLAAVTLTYLSITFSSIPVDIRQFNQQARSTGKAPVTAANLAPNVVLLAAVSLVVPFLDLTRGLGGLLGAFILFLGLQRAWAMTGRVNLAVLGPFRREETASVG